MIFKNWNYLKILQGRAFKQHVLFVDNNPQQLTHKFLHETQRQQNILDISKPPSFNFSTSIVLWSQPCHEF